MKKPARLLFAAACFLLASASAWALSSSDVVKGLKDALSLGSRNAAALASRVDGFYKNPKIFIPFPPEALKVKSTAEKLGLQKQVDDFVKSLNRAAEKAAKDAAPIFLDAVTSLTISDGMKILKGPDDAATSYLKSKTSSRLKAKFEPTVHAALASVQAAQYWKPLAATYNKLPLGGGKIDPNLDAYVTDRAINGLFKLVADEERKIRKDPAARVTDILRTVFGG